MTTTLKFPQDILRFLYWVFFKPITLENYLREIDPNLRIDESLIVLWRHGRKNPPLRTLVWLSLFHILITPWLIGFPVAGLFVLAGFDVNWFGVTSGVAGGVVFGAAVSVAISATHGVTVSVVDGVAFGMAGGVAVGIAVGVAVGVMVGIVIGVAFGMVGGLAFGEAIAVTIALPVGVVICLMGGAADGVAGGIAGGVAFGIAGAVAGGTEFSMAGGVAFGVALGAGLGVACSVAGGIEFGVAGGVAGGIAFITSYFRLPLYLFELPWQFFLGQSSQTSPLLRTRQVLRLSPIYWDELVWFPLLGLDQQLITLGKQNCDFARAAIGDVTQSFRQQWAARNALIELTAYDVERAQNAKAIANIADQFAWLPPTMPTDLENVLPPIRDIAQYAQAALESDTLYNKQTQLRNAIAQTKRVREGLALSNNRQIASRFGRALETWEQVLGKELSGLDAREVIPNVFVAGSPLATASKVFKGRHDLFVALERELASHAEQRPTLLLFGARRSGKTSAIKQMPVRLGPDVIPVEVDLQSAATAEDVRGLLFVIADQIKRNALTHRRVQLPSLTRDDLRADPYVVFRDWLNRVQDQVGNRWILLNLDEYEKLAQMIEEGRIDARVFDFLRGIIQHHLRITVLLSGSHTIDDVGAKHFSPALRAKNASPLLSDYLINVRVLKIENLKADEARELIVKPIENFPLQYEPSAVERILAVTGCQPFLLQATCRDLVNQLNEQNKMLATQDDADRALESVLTTGVAYFQDLWSNPRDSDDAQRAVMRAIATKQDLTGLGNLSGLSAALRKLVQRDILAPVIASEAKQSPTNLDANAALSQPFDSASLRSGALLAMTNQYRFRVELVRRWVEQQP